MDAGVAATGGMLGAMRVRNVAPVLRSRKSSSHVTRSRTSPIRVRARLGGLGGDGQLAQIRHQPAQAFGLLDDVSGEVQDLFQLDVALLEQQLGESLDGEPRLPQLVNLLGGEASELGQPPGGGQQLADAAQLLGPGPGLSNTTSQALEGRAEELRRVRELLAAAGRLAEFGRFAAQQIHELRQPLFAIKGLAQLLLEKDHVELEEVLDFARHIVEQSERLGGLVSNLRQLSVPTQPASRARAEIGDVLLRVTSLLDFRLRKTGATLRTRIAPDIPPVAATPASIEQVLINLLANALDAVKGSTHPLVQLRAQVLAENPRFAVIEVADNGPGVAKAVRPRLFESFFTTKGDEQGTGLGLAVSRELARGAGGDLTLLDEATGWPEPAVTVFRLMLPVSQEL